MVTRLGARSHDLWRDGGRSVALEGVFDTVRGTTDLGPPARIPSWSATARLLWKGDRTDGKHMQTG